MLGFPIEAWYAPDFWSDRLHPADRDWVLALCRDTLRDNTPDTSDLEYRLVSADGSTVWVRDIASRIPRSDGPPLLRGFMFNITDRRNAERARQESEALAFQLLSNAFIRHVTVTPRFDVHHRDVRRVLTAILKVFDPFEARLGTQRVAQRDPFVSHLVPRGTRAWHQPC